MPASFQAFSIELDRCARRIEDRLETLLKRYVPSPPPARLGEAMRYALLGGGKRLRPFLVLTTAGLFGIAEDKALNAAAGLECIHSYSLVHDDLPAMDDDDLRRGRPTVHIAFDEATAILAGDALLTLAFQIVSAPETHPDPAVRAKLTARLAQAAGVAGMVGGQALDLAAEGKSLSLEEIARMQAMKTGALFSFAAEAGAILGGASEAEQAAIAAYAAGLGQAFQLADDLLDEEGSIEETGKAVAKDAGRGKATLIALLGADEARRRLAALLANSDAALAPFGERAETLKALSRYVGQRTG